MNNAILFNVGNLIIPIIIIIMVFIVIGLLVYVAIVSGIKKGKIKYEKSN